MTKFLVITKKHVRIATLVLLLLLVAAACLKWNQQSQAAMGSAAPAPGVKVYQMVTGEFESRTSDGKMVEAYGWFPGSLPVKAGEEVELRITGISGQDHPFVIEGLDVKGTVSKGKTTVVRFKAEQKGIYQIVCLTHTTPEQNGPMVGYISVQ